MKIAIVDDEQSSVNALSKKLKTFPDAEIIGSATCGRDGLSILQKSDVDLIFLDVEMPDISGLEFLDKMKEFRNNVNCRIVVYSSYEEYLLSAFRKDAFDFLHKPIDDSELQEIMERFYADQQSNADENELYENDSEQGGQRQNKGILLYLNAVDFRLFHLEDICLFSYNRKQRYWEVVVANESKTISLKRSVTSKTILNLNKHFVQVHQTFIINFNYLTGVTDNICHFYPPFDGIDYVSVSRLYRSKLIKKFYSL